MNESRLRAARARIAAVVLPPPVSAALGTVSLREDQCDLAARALRHVQRYGGCLIADDVGQGKTYVALAVAREWRQPLVVVPASLRTTWRDAMGRAGVAHPIVTHETLSRGRLPPLDADLVVVDESHRFRTPTSKRYDALATLSARAPLVLLSATPLQNGPHDLRAQLALFLGERAWLMDERALVAHVARGAGAPSALLPAVAAPRWITPDVDESDVLDALLALPAPARPLDGGDAGALRTISLVRAWASSRAALRASLRRRRMVAHSLEQAALDGRQPTRSELRAWCGNGAGDVQLGFATMLAAASVRTFDAMTIVDAVRRELEALDTVEHMLAERADPDLARVQALRALRERHGGASILAFSELAATVRAYASRLRGEAGIGVLSARDARIASGRIARDELLVRFAPLAQGAAPPPDRERVSFLLATDLLSEGVNLQDASVVVHLDLPWNPARLAQRVGRVRRSGGAPIVYTYLLAPPARAELLLDVESRLRGKLARAESTIGRAIPVVPSQWGSVASSTSGPPSGSTSAAAQGELHERLARWRSAHAGVARQGPPIVAAVGADVDGWLVALSDGRLLASLDGAPPDSAQSVRAARLADGAAALVDASRIDSAIASVMRFLERERTAAECGLALATSVHQATERRIAVALRRMPRHERAMAASLATRLRDRLRAPLSLGLERLLASLSATHAEQDLAWLSRAVAIVDSGTVAAGPPQRRPAVDVLILLAR